jgi:hypothetical protein
VRINRINPMDPEPPLHNLRFAVLTNHPLRVFPNRGVRG